MEPEAIRVKRGGEIAKWPVLGPPISAFGDRRCKPFGTEKRKDLERESGNP
jgi:hypothetical protein